VAPHVPEELARVVDQALGFSRVERFADARAMRGALRSAAALLLGEPFSPISPRIPDAARVSTHDDLHGATLVAPVEVTSAITGRGETGTTTGQPVTRPTVVSRRPPRGRAPLLVILAGLGLAGLAGLLFAARRQANAERSVLPTALLTASGAAQEPTASAVDAPPAVAAILDTASSASVRVTPPPAIGTRKSTPVVHLHPAPHSAPVLEKPPVKSLLGGDNPFDRRH
jgi:hypothetical protein